MPSSCAGANATTAACQAVHEIPVGLQLVAGVNTNETDPATIASNEKAAHAKCLRGNSYLIVDAPDFQAMWDAGCGEQPLVRRRDLFVVRTGPVAEIHVTRRYSCVTPVGQIPAGVSYRVAMG